MRTNEEYQNLEAERDALAARVAEMRSTLAAIVTAEWRTWEELASPEEFVRWAKSRANHAIAQDNDSAAILARRDADTLEMAKRRWYSGEFNFLCAEDAMQRMADEFRASAAELGKAHV